MHNIEQIKNTILEGDVLEQLRLLPDNSINCIITSPPYWAARTYFVEGQIGQEDHPSSYIDKIIEVIKECKRVIKPTGSIVINLGDSFYSKSGSGQGNNSPERQKILDGGTGVLYKAQQEIRGKYKTNWLQHKQKLLIPERIAIKCQDDLGLIVRSHIHWVKKVVNWKTKQSWGCAMPSSTQDRMTTHSESIFHMVKDPKYFFNLDAIRIPIKDASVKREGYGFNKGTKSDFTSMRNLDRYSNPKGANIGDCIMFPFDFSHLPHHAMFPQSLPDLFIRACTKEGDIVLDPFSGMGTTGVAALQLGRFYIGIELNKNYADLSRKRLEPYLGQKRL